MDSDSVCSLVLRTGHEPTDNTRAETPQPFWRPVLSEHPCGVSLFLFASWAGSTCRKGGLVPLTFLPQSPSEKAQASPSLLPAPSRQLEAAVSSTPEPSLLRAGHRSSLSLPSDAVCPGPSLPPVPSAGPTPLPSGPFLYGGDHNGTPEAQGRCKNDTKEERKVLSLVTVYSYCGC